MKKSEKYTETIQDVQPVEPTIEMEIIEEAEPTIEMEIIEEVK